MACTSRSTAGKTWEHLGLRDGQQIASIAVDPKDENRLFVAVLGHPYGPNEERGVYRSTDGGRTFQRVLYKDADTGAFQVEIDPKNPQDDLCRPVGGPAGPVGKRRVAGQRERPFQIDRRRQYLEETDQRACRPIEQGLGPHRLRHLPQRPKTSLRDGRCRRPVRPVFTPRTTAAKAGTLVNSDPRLWGRGSDFAEIRVHPNDPNTIFVANVASYKSTDGGKTFIRL